MFGWLFAFGLLGVSPALPSNLGPGLGFFEEPVVAPTSHEEFARLLEHPEKIRTLDLRKICLTKKEIFALLGSKSMMALDSLAISMKPCAEDKSGGTSYDGRRRRSLPSASWLVRRLRAFKVEGIASPDGLKAAHLLYYDWFTSHIFPRLKLIDFSFDPESYDMYPLDLSRIAPNLEYLSMIGAGWSNHTYKEYDCNVGDYRDLWFGRFALRGLYKLRRLNISYLNSHLQGGKSLDWSGLRYVSWIDLSVGGSYDDVLKFGPDDSLDGDASEHIIFFGEGSRYLSDAEVLILDHVDRESGEPVSCPGGFEPNEWQLEYLHDLGGFERLRCLSLRGCVLSKTAMIALLDSPLDKNLRYLVLSRGAYEPEDFEEFSRHTDAKIILDEPFCRETYVPTAVR